MKLLLPALAALAWTAHGQTVEGRVTNAATGRPVAGATVVLQGGTDSYVVDTDDNGRFRASDVVPGQYEARATRDGFTALARGAAAKTHPRFVMEAGRNVRDIGVWLVPLGAISGRVMDGDGDPARKGWVAALGYSYGGGKKELREVGRSATDDRGEYRVSGLPPGIYFLRFSPGPVLMNFQMSSLRVLGTKPAYALGTTYYPASADTAGATPVELPPGGEVRDRAILVHPEQLYTIRVTLMAPTGGGSAPAIGVSSPNGMGLMMSAQYGVTRSFPDSAPGSYLVEGRDSTAGLDMQRWVKVVNSDVDVTLTPTPNVTLGGLVWADGGRRLALDEVRVSLHAEDAYKETTAKADGTFSIQRIQPVPYNIGVSVPAGGYLKAIRLGERVLAGPQIDLSGSTAAFEILLGTDGGRVHGTVSDAGGAPAEGAVVVAVPAGRLREWTDLVRSATADRDGKFELRDLAPGDYRIFAWEDAEEGAPLDADFRRPFEARGVDVRVEANGREEVQLRSISLLAGK